MNEDSPYPAVTDEAVLQIVHEVSTELHPGRKDMGPVTPDSALAEDLGLDSLARVELLTRIERAFGVRLPEQILNTAESPRDLLRALLAARTPLRAEAFLAARFAAPERVSQAPDTATTLHEVLDWHVRAHPEREHIIVDGGDGGEARLRYIDLQQGAASVAAGLLGRGFQPGQAAAIMLPTGHEYFFSFVGILLAGGIPVPIYPPARATQIEEHLRRHVGILSNALVTALITVPQAKALATLLKSQVPSLRIVCTVKELSSCTVSLERITAHADDIALLQYTSGSTGHPKGAVLTHANLLANLRAMGRVLGVSSEDVFVSWLPLYHDMGLIGAWLGSLYYAFPLVVMSPLTFLARPERWLWAVHRYRGTLSGGPNFGYELCLRKLDEAALDGLDLSSWRFAFNGAEPVSATTMLEFQQRFARYGLRPDALAPVYGLAEASLGLAFPPPGRGLMIDRIDRQAFSRSGRALPAASGASDVLLVVACGRPLPDHEVRLVDATGCEVAERQEGRLLFKGPSATCGYFRNPKETRRLFDGEWLDSGDYAYMAKGDVYITGRAKDVIIRGGRQVFPYDLEEAVGAIPGVRKGCVAVFGSPDPRTRTERVVVMAETRGTTPEAQLRRQINTAAVDVLGAPPDDVVLVPPHTVLKTSSGKIRRAASRELYEKGGATATQPAPWRQIARFAWQAVLPQLRRAGRVGAEVAYAGYAWLLFWMLAPITWALAGVLPKPSWSWALSRLTARLFIRLSGLPFTVEGLANLPREETCVVVANHASYLDGIILVAALPRHFSFVAKRSLLEQFIPRVYLQSLGTVFVDRDNSQRGVEDVARATRAVCAGSAMLFFPEGTFRRVPGLLPFQAGAFSAAAQAGVAVVPVTIRGTRSVLRDGQWFPRRGPISVMVSTPIRPDGDDWSASIRLRDAVRTEILTRCGEPDANDENLLHS
ncbi:AMP-binding protein [Crenobacter cavernae]|uniref:Acyl-phosphate glycerol 3-phosphate acyltransferase n=1 Tax=Crenobacter cavernae TaxID=2290923 RepID=A0ABY0FAW7_9NEIS|nr:AMP-binding protein [Crenobacter cavernae]RXZ42797.1 acyl-phosphate glycerol 3-phosphate acyltransferase [Crenobacter cavernae]